MTKFIFLSVAIVLSGVSVAQTKTFKLRTSDKEILTFVSHKEMSVAPSCVKGDCLALKEVRESKGDSLKRKLEGHPAAKFCETHGGIYIVGTYDDGDQDGVCRFKDSSYILGWDYYKKNQIKSAGSR